jgi:HSP20 family protein
MTGQTNRQGCQFKNKRTARSQRLNQMNTLTKWNPFRKGAEIETLQPATRFTGIDEMEDLLRSMQRALSMWPSKGAEPVAFAQWSPSVDIGEDDNEFVLKAELPDVPKQDIEVTVQDGALSIKGERKFEKIEEGMTFHRMERAFGRFERTFTIPPEADKGRISSEYKSGILTVHLPKNLGSKRSAHRIEIR